MDSIRDLLAWFGNERSGPNPFEILGRDKYFRPTWFAGMSPARILVLTVVVV
jgi:hypothetical protein